ncbi:MAG: thioesterase family protein, partial [Ferruginibacter sp.]
MARIKIDIPGDNNIAAVHIRVRISDINYGNHVGNDAFVSFIHEARLQWLQQNNFTELDINGIGLIMSGMVFEFKNESFYGEEISIMISTGDISKASFDLYYQLTTERNNETILLARAKTEMVCFDYGYKKVTPIPPELF